MVGKISLESVEQTKRHSARFARDDLDFTSDLLLRVDSIQQEPQHEPKVLVRLRNLSSPRHVVCRGTNSQLVPEKNDYRIPMRSTRRLHDDCGRGGR
jgi:hypothetical protein